MLRGLDTIEDDMTLPLSVKQPLLVSFHEIIRKPGWTFTGSGPAEKDRQLLVEFNVVIEEFGKLPADIKDVIADITKQMGAGMSDFAAKDLKDVVSAHDYNLYCHYVAGLIGIGLSKLFWLSGLEAKEVGNDPDVANSMGLFLQKTNIIRDFLEDLTEGRSWWPRDTWAKYTDSLPSLSKPDNRTQALACLNDLITDALQHVPDVFTYMSRLRNQSVFNFCAIPQVMAVATLARCYNNPKVFAGVVKIRKGEAVHLMMRATNMSALYAIFEEQLIVISRQIPKQDPSAPQTNAIIKTSQGLIASARVAGVLPETPASSLSSNLVFLAIGIAAGYYIKSSLQQKL